MISAIGNRFDRRRGRRGRQGFSLVEIVLVVGLIALVAGMMVANIGVIADRGEEQSTEELVKAAVRAARFEAARSRTVTRLSFDEDTGQLQVSSDGNEGNSFDLGSQFARGGSGAIRFYLVPSSEGLEAPEDANTARIETVAVRFAPDRSSSPFVLEIDYGTGSPERRVFDPFSSLTIKPE